MSVRGRLALRVRRRVGVRGDASPSDPHRFGLRTVRGRLCSLTRPPRRGGLPGGRPMVATNRLAPIPIALDRLQADFAALLPRVEHTIRFHLRQIRCPDHRADAVAEAVAVAWHWYRRCAERGKDATQFVTSLASLAARFVRAGRGLCGRQDSADALSPLAQRRHGFIAVPLKTGSGLVGDGSEDALIENTRSRVTDKVRVRSDFRRWVGWVGGR